MGTDEDDDYMRRFWWAVPSVFIVGGVLIGLLTKNWGFLIPAPFALLLAWFVWGRD